MKRLLTAVVIGLFFYLPYGLAFTVKVPEAKGAFPDDFLTYVWAFESEKPQVLDVELESLEGWQIQGNVKRKLSILPDVPSFLAVSVQVPKSAFEGSYAESLVLKIAQESYTGKYVERYTVATEVGFVSGLDIQSDASMVYSGDSTLWSVELHNTGNGGDVYTIQVGREQQSRQVNLAANESVEVHMPIGVGYQAYSIRSLRDETLVREGRVHVQNSQVRQFSSADEPYALRTQFSTQYSTENNSIVDVRLHGNVSDYVYSDYKLLYTQKTSGDILELDNVASSLRLEGLEDSWFIEGDVAKDKLEFAGGYSNQNSTVVLSSDILKLEAQISADQIFAKQNLVAGFNALVNVSDAADSASDISDVSEARANTNLTTQDASSSPTSTKQNIVDLNFYASQVFGDGSKGNSLKRVSEEELELLNIDDLAFEALTTEFENLTTPKSTPEPTNNSEANWLSTLSGDWDLRFGVQSKTWQDYDLNLNAQTTLEFDEVESRFGLKVDDILTDPDVELSASLNYNSLKSQLKVSPTAQDDEAYWDFSLNHQYFNSNNRFQLNDTGDWSLQNSMWWSVLDGFTLKFVNELKGVDSDLSFGVDISALNFQNTISSYEALPFMQFSTDKLEEAVVGVDFRARALLGADTSVAVFWLPFEGRLGANINSELYFDATKFSSELRYSDANGTQQVGAKLSVVHPLVLEQKQSINLIGNVGFNTSLLNETSPTAAEQTFTIPESSSSQGESDWYISVGLKWNDATALSENIVEFFGGRKTAMLSGKVDVIGADIPENLIVKAGSQELIVDATGYFSQEVPEGNYSLSIDPNSIPSGFFAGQSDVSVDVGQADNKHDGQPEVLLTLFAAASVRGKLSVPDNIPSYNTPSYISNRSNTTLPRVLPRVTVDLKNQKGLTLSLSSDNRGDFQLDNLRPGVYEAFVHVPDGWQIKQQSFQIVIAAGEASAFQLELFPKLIEQRSFQPNRVRIRAVEVEADSVPPDSRPLIDVILRGEASQVSVSQGGEIQLLEEDSSGIWQGRIDVPMTAKGSAAFDIVATDKAGNETKYPLFMTVEETALWGVATLPQAVLDEGLVQARVHWFTDDIVESQVNFMGKDYPMQGSGADWQTQFKIESSVEQATRLPITFSAKRSAGDVIDLKRILVVQPK